MIRIDTVRSHTSDIFCQGVLDPSAILSPTKPYYAVVDSNARWVFRTGFGRFKNVDKVFVLNEPGEEKKNLKTVQAILQALLEAKADRTATLLVIGGGVTLDLGGFAASIFKRGIDWIAVPTTLLAQVDASVGGKTAVNHPLGKNIIGAFHPPSCVLVSASVAETWNDLHYLEGRAEMYKIFKLFDHRSLLGLLKDPQTDHLTRRSIQLKARIVRLDPWEKDIRAALNYGHTFGHAFEHALKLRHGLSVALGIRCENVVAERRGLMSRSTREACDAELSALQFTLPPRLPRFERLLPYVEQDKKNVGSAVGICLTNGLKQHRFCNRDPRVWVTLSDLRDAYSCFCEENRIPLED
jgi:3-dehydroquinate synthase